jgi:hypothetical protein
VLHVPGEVDAYSGDRTVAGRREFNSLLTRTFATFYTSKVGWEIGHEHAAGAAAKGTFAQPQAKERQKFKSCPTPPRVAPLGTRGAASLSPRACVCACAPRAYRPPTHDAL